jgi:hypothetical protein
MRHVSDSHVWNLVPDTGGNGPVCFPFPAWLRDAFVCSGHDRNLVPAVSRGDM